jgi:DNA end-binding protein Ku
MSDVTALVPASAVPPPEPEAGPAQGPAGRGRPSWSGLLQVGLLAVPLKAYPAIASAPELPGHLLHAGCGRRLRYEKRCPAHGPVDAGAVVKGYEYAPQQFLVLDEAELEALRPAQDRALALDCFLDLEQLDPAQLAGRTLYLVPDGPAARPAYRVLAHALREQRKRALGRLVLSGRRQLALLRPVGRLLVLHLLYFPAQLRNPAALEEELRSVPVGEAEARLAVALIEAYSRPPRWSDYRDDSAERLAALVEARLRGLSSPSPVPEEVPALTLLDALRQSVAALQAAPAESAASGVAGTGKKKPRRVTP